MAGAVPGLVPVLPGTSAVRSFWMQINPDSRQLARVRATIDFIVDRLEANLEQFLVLPGGEGEPQGISLGADGNGLV